MSVRKTTTLLAVHVTATPPNRDIGTAEIDKMHKAQGWSGIGYHRVVRRNGVREPGRDINTIGAHVAGFNSISIGTVLVGGVDASLRPEHNATPEQMAGLEAELRDQLNRFPSAKICGHRDLSPDRNKDGIISPSEWLKACPCFDVIPWAASLGLPVADIRGEWSDAARKAPLPQPDANEQRNAYLQRLLIRAGYPLGPDDGIIGPKTIAAIRAFQFASGLPETGLFDNATVALLRGLFEQAAA